MMQKNKNTLTCFLSCYFLSLVIFISSLTGATDVYATLADTGENVQTNDSSSDMDATEETDSETTNDSQNPVADNLEFEADAAKRLAEPIASNDIPNWPTGPVVGAQGAILIEAQTGTILYAKNIHEKLYPASTTKILTSLVAIENSSLSDTVTFSQNAVFSIEKASSNMGMDPGQELTMEQCLHGILIMSANEVCNAVAEHVGGSIENFVKMMNEKASALGCLNSNFVTTNGLQDVNHYTTAYDLAQIARAFFENETLAKISGIRYEVLEPTEKQPDRIELYTHNELTKGTYACEGYIGGKTGYTSMAHQTLVTCAKRNGMKLICVVMKEDSPNQFTDTMALFDYGFNNFKKYPVKDYETKYTVNNSDFFKSSGHIFGNEEAIMTIDPKSYVVLPSTIDFSQAQSEISFTDDQSDSNVVANIKYSYEGMPIGDATIYLADSSSESYDFDLPIRGSDAAVEQENIIFVNIVKIILIVVAILLILTLLIILRSITKNFHFTIKRRRREPIKFKADRSRERRNQKKRIKRSKKNNRGPHF